MAQQIVNIGNGYRMDRQSAEMAIDACSAAWVVEGVSLRSLSSDEAITARNEQARLACLRDLPHPEVHGLSFAPPASGVMAHLWERRWLSEARDFAAQAV